jgi:hypothetical protein
MVTFGPSRQIVTVPRKKTFSQKLNKAVGAGLESASQIQEAYQQKEKAETTLKKENEFIKKETGMDVSGLSGKPREKIIEQAYKAKEKRDFLDHILHRNKETEPEMGRQTAPELGGAEEQLEGPSGERKVQLETLFPEDEIIAASMINPQLANLMQKQNEQKIAEGRYEQEQYEKQRRESPEYKRTEALNKAQVEDDIAFVNELNKSLKTNILRTKTINNLENLNKKGITGKAYEKGLEKIGLIGLTSEGRREFSSEVKNLLTDLKSILGSQFSASEFNILLNSYPSSDFSQEANQAIIDNLRDFQDIKNYEFQVTNELIEQNGDEIPPKVRFKINKKVEEYAHTKYEDIRKNLQTIYNEQNGIPKGHSLLVDPNGFEYEVPNDMVNELVELGAKVKMSNE